MRGKTLIFARRILIAFLGMVPLAILGRLHWASMEPSKPLWMPPSSVWVPGPHTPLEFHRVGQWVGCLTDSPSSAKCSFVDGEDHLMWQGRMILLSRKDIHGLSICPGKDAFSIKWSRKTGRPIRIVHLTDGDSLAPPDSVDEMRTTAN